MRRLIAFLAVLLLAPTLAMAGPKIWQDAEGGMTPNEITALYPEAKAGTNDTIGQTEPATELLRIPAHVFLDEPFTVRFFFKGEKLDMVMLTHEDPGRTSLDSIKKYLDRFSTFYGDPKVHDSHPQLDFPGITYRQFRWQGGERNVVIVWVKAADGEPIMNINHTPR